MKLLVKRDKKENIVLKMSIDEEEYDFAYSSFIEYLYYNDPLVIDYIEGVTEEEKQQLNEMIEQIKKLVEDSQIKKEDAKIE